jgi:predicted nucleic acid-binding protein
MMLPVVPETVTTWLQGQPQRLLYTTALTQAEIALGVAMLPQGRRRAELAYRARMQWELQFEGRVLEFNSVAAAAVLECASLRAAAELPVSVPDIWIAALARVHGATLVTRNTRDYEHCGVRLLNPWDAADS